MADVNAGANANAGHASGIEQSSLDEHHGVARNIVEEENAAYGTGRPERDVGANMEAHGKALKDRVDDASDRVQRGPKKADPTDDGRFQVGNEEVSDAHDLASSRQP